MPRASRSSARISSSAVEPAQPPPPPPQAPLDPVSENLRTLRQHWKWAAFCQFFYIFFDLLAINDISLEDIETDLAHGTDVFLPRIMQRLLFTLSYDRKISLENWQNALRRQYDRRNPDSNPLGSQSVVHTASNSRFSSVLKEDEPKEEEAKGKEEKEKENGDVAVEPKAEETPDEAPALKEEEKESAPTLKKKGERAASAVEPEKATIDWSELTMDQKLESMHTLVEWQFQNPARLRQIMKSDDENATWRSEPIGYDRDSNAYWLIGGNRLWIQRAPPKPPSRKRKRKATTAPELKGRNASKANSSKRQRTSKSQSSTRTKAPAAKEPPPTPITGRSSRAAKEQAKAKLDAQAKALEEFNRQAAAESSASAAATLAISASGRPTRSTRGAAAASAAASAKATPVPAASNLRSSGTRISARLRGLQDDGWQAVPDEWLNGGEGSSKALKTGLESDDGSELTELSDEEEEKEEEEKEEEEVEDAKGDEDPEPEEGSAPKGPFIEWETLCITLAEWQAFPERFAKSTYYAEKAFYKFLTQIVVPEVVAELKAIEEKRRLEEALSHRKRSSRLATREHEKEAAKLAAQKKAEDEERNSRARRLEARQQREEAERLKKEKAREERRLKRESRAVEQELGKDEDDEDEAGDEDEDEEDDEPEPKDDNEEYVPSAKPNGTKRSTRKPRASSALQQSRAPAKKAPSSAKAKTDEWELSCEVCGTMGKNLDDGKPMMSCGMCGKWQHIPCHDARDARLGRPKRNWNKIDFLCQRCLASRAQQHRYANGAGAHHHPQQLQPHHGQHPQQQHYQLHTATQYAGRAPQLGSWQVGTGVGGYGKSVYGVPEPSAYAQSYLQPTSSVRSSSSTAQGAAAYGAQGQGQGQTVYANPNPYMQPGGGGIAFSHYQPQDRAFAVEGESARVQQQQVQQQQSSYYRMNGHTHSQSSSAASGWGGESGRGYHHQSYVPPQHAWNASHYSNHSSSSHYATSNHHTPLTTPATFQQQQAAQAAAAASRNGVTLDGPGTHSPPATSGVGSTGGGSVRSGYDILAREAAYRQAQMQQAHQPGHSHSPLQTIAAVAAASSGVQQLGQQQQGAEPSPSSVPVSYHRASAAYHPPPPTQ